MTYHVAAFYRFLRITDGVALRARLKQPFIDLGLCGTLLIAPEGINGTIAGQGDALTKMLELLKEHTGLERHHVKFSTAPEKPFNKLKIRLKREIITFNQPQTDPVNNAGTAVEPSAWNELMRDPDVIVLDTRNAYETAIGRFERAVDPHIEQFTDFATFVREQLDPQKHKKIAMYCTGGIRCEKASAFMRQEGFEEVYQLKGGILKYLEEIPEQESAWQGDCYVFDKRMAVGHGLKTGHYSMCFCCGYPLTAEDKQHEHFEDGVSCAYCFTQSTDADKKRYRERHQQIMAQLAKARDQNQST